jgi:lipopolysaccharide export system permease protein
MATSTANIFQRSIAREFTSVGVAVVSVLVAIIVTYQMILFLGRAASGSIEPESVMVMLGFSLLVYLPVLLALSLFVAILMTLTRSYRDSEMPVWFSSGLPITAWVRPVVTFGLPVVLVTALLSMVLTPWALSEQREYQRILRSKDDASRLSPGSFIEARGSNRVFFIDNTSNDTEVVMNNVFVQYNQNERFGVVVSETGYQQIEPNGDKFLVLKNGRRYEGTPGALDFRIIDFERQKIRIEAREAAADEPSTRQLSTWALLSEPNAERMAECHWRIALPVAAMVLALMAIPLSFVNPRSGTSWNLILAIMVFFLYYNLLKSFEAWTILGKVPVWIGVTPVHLAMVALLVGLFSRQMRSFAWLWGGAK